MKFGLENTSRAMKLLGNPHLDFKALHIAGTNGKGSVSTMLASILMREGFSVGLYTSPHLLDLRERITINGEQIPEDRLLESVEFIRELFENKAIAKLKLTFFEFVTAIAMRYFSEENVEIVVAETGLGGRFDATNILKPSIVAITRIGIDHTEQLGDKIESVAYEKAGIMKKGATIVSSAMDSTASDMIRKRALKLGCQVVEQGKDFEFVNASSNLSGTVFDFIGARKLNRVRTNLLGRHQAENCATAIASCDMFARKEKLNIQDNSILKGLENLRLRGRLEILAQKPLTIIDCGHNPSAIQQTLNSLSDLGKRPDTVIYASSKDKDYKRIASILFPATGRLVLTRYGNERAVNPAILGKIAESMHSENIVVDSISDALETARKITREGETILIIGSIFLVAETLSLVEFGKRADVSIAGF